MGGNTVDWSSDGGDDTASVHRCSIFVLKERGGGGGDGVDRGACCTTLGVISQKEGGKASTTPHPKWLAC